MFCPSFCSRASARGRGLAHPAPFVSCKPAAFPSVSAAAPVRCAETCRSGHTTRYTLIPAAPLLACLPPSPQVNNTYLPRSQEERELVARTIFVGNIDRIVEREQLREFFENLCGECREGL